MIRFWMEKMTKLYKEFNRIWIKIYHAAFFFFALLDFLDGEKKVFGQFVFNARLLDLTHISRKNLPNTIFLPKYESILKLKLQHISNVIQSFVIEIITL